MSECVCVYVCMCGRERERREWVAGKKRVHQRKEETENMPYFNVCYNKWSILTSCMSYIFLKCIDRLRRTQIECLSSRYLPWHSITNCGPHSMPMQHSIQLRVDSTYFIPKLPAILKGKLISVYPNSPGIKIKPTNLLQNTAPTCTCIHLRKWLKARNK